MNQLKHESTRFAFVWPSMYVPNGFYVRKFLPLVIGGQACHFSIRMTILVGCLLYLISEERTLVSRRHVTRISLISVL
jgi:hypothetical protein